MGAIDWQECLYRLEQEIPAHEFTTYIRPLQAHEVDGEIHLLAPNRYILDQVNGLFLQKIEFMAQELGASKVSLQIGSSHAVRSGPGGNPGQRAQASNTFAERESFYPLLDLNKDFTFDTFVEGRSNEFARAAAVQVSENVGKSSKCLLLYGGVGLGKTHLMHAVGNAILDRNPNLKVAYMDSERIMEDMVKAIERGAVSEFTQ